MEIAALTAKICVIKPIFFSIRRIVSKIKFDSVQTLSLEKSKLNKRDIYCENPMQAGYDLARSLISLLSYKMLIIRGLHLQSQFFNRGRCYFHNCPYYEYDNRSLR